MNLAWFYVTLWCFETSWPTTFVALSRELTGKHWDNAFSSTCTIIQCFIDIKSENKKTLGSHAPSSMFCKLRMSIWITYSSFIQEHLKYVPVCTNWRLKCKIEICHELAYNEDNLRLGLASVFDKGVINIPVSPVLTETGSWEILQ